MIRKSPRPQGRRTPRLAKVCALAAGLLLAAAPAATAVPGDLDTSFGTGGKVTTDFGASPSEPEVGNALLRLPTGELYVAGRRGFSVPLAGGNATFGITKYTADGSLDTSFGTGGKVSTGFGQPLALARDIIRLSDGKTLAGGFTGGEQIADLALAKYNADGSLDTSFGGDGKVTTDLTGGLGDGIRGLAETADGKILAAGAAGPDSFLARYLADGSLDTSFGGGDGITITDFGTGDHLFAMQELPNGKIIGAGTANGDFLLTRFNADGTLDTTFSGDGKATTDFGGFNDLAFGFTADQDGKYLITGAVDATEPFGDVAPIKTGVARYNTDGSPDTTFSGDGKLETDVDPKLADEGRDITVDSNGKIVVAGLTGEVSPFPNDPSAGDMLALRYTSAGALDTSFHGDGIATVDFDGGADVARGVALTSGNDIILAGGAASSDTGLDFALAKLKG